MSHPRTLRKTNRDWGGGSAGKALALQAQGPEFKPQKACKRLAWWQVVVIPTMERWRQEDPGGSLASHSSPIGELQSSERPCFRGVDSITEEDTEIVL